MSKYQKLWNYLVENNLGELELSFEKINEILGFTINHDFLKAKKEANKYGYEIIKIFLKDQKIKFRKLR